MRPRTGMLLLGVLLLIGCGKAEPPQTIVVSVNDYQVTAEEFEEVFASSPYALRNDAQIARRDFLDNLVNQKLIVQEAIAKGLDKQKDFLRSVERFWEQSLMTVALGAKTREINGSIRVHEDNIRRLYDEMVREGLTEKTYEEMFPQIKWQAERQLEAQMLGEWMEGLKKNAQVVINREYLKKK
ncbi:MAG: hypothetical protein GX606_01225 [Elusimicrobia bacterium]|nr:hypothetical protein [Elusimicrobiota bacterium]